MRKMTMAAFAVLALVGLLFGDPVLAFAGDTVTPTVQLAGGKGKPGGKKHHGKKHHGKKHGKKQGKKNKGGKNKGGKNKGGKRRGSRGNR